MVRDVGAATQKAAGLLEVLFFAVVVTRTHLFSLPVKHLIWGRCLLIVSLFDYDTILIRLEPEMRLETLKPR